ncbi:MAG TPA: glycosyltransferase [Thermoleophilaceae bacterium]|nr:glycosyltransferase [Thermoleophilaceae bacterium]
MIVRACPLAAALGLMRRLGRGHRPGPPLVDDQSSDRTAAVGEEHGAAVLAGRALPAGSADKGLALDQGLRAARGDLVLFLDANHLPPPGSHAARSVDGSAAHRENP